MSPEPAIEHEALPMSARAISTSPEPAILAFTLPALMSFTPMSPEPDIENSATPAFAAPISTSPEPETLTLTASAVTPLILTSPEPAIAAENFRVLMSPFAVKSPEPLTLTLEIAGEVM